MNPDATAVGGIYGYSSTCGGYDGWQAEYVRVPFADVGPYARLRSRRVDVVHQPLDAALVTAPWLAAGGAVFAAARALVRRSRR